MKLLSGCATGQLLCQGGSSRQSRTSARTRGHECGSCKEGSANSSTEKLVAKDRPAQQSDSQKIHPKVLTDGLQAEPSQVPCLAPAFPRLCELTGRVIISAEDAWACRSGRFCGRGKIRGAFAGRHPKLAWRPFQGVKCGKASKRRGSELQTRRGFSVGVPCKLLPSEAPETLQVGFRFLLKLVVRTRRCKAGGWNGYEEPAQRAKRGHATQPHRSGGMKKGMAEPSPDEAFFWEAQLSESGRCASHFLRAAPANMTMPAKAPAIQVEASGTASTIMR
jgi:hypothetical protein